MIRVTAAWKKLGLVSPGPRGCDWAVSHAALPVVDVSVRKWLDDREAVGVGNVVAAEPGLVVGLHDGKLVDGGWGNVGGKPQHRVDSRLIQILSCSRRRIGPPGQRRQSLDRRFLHDPAH